ncbi:hypothetical protein BDV98DRAFT_586281 [Pterulicium gracile]|uniref:Uncharacterized protein n=1 Tax=Pterulicium gracile TaxID=1884261 RepID=A0A5C3Q5P7_9AGAR|nr:hypothetical protein BDV98DRAFT_586281 [Pterula gracilis]
MDSSAAQTCTQEVSAKNAEKHEHNMEKDKPVHQEVVCNAKACNSVNRSPVKCRDNCQRKGIHVYNKGVATGPKVQRLVKSNRTLTGHARSKSEVFADNPYSFQLRLSEEREQTIISGTFGGNTGKKRAEIKAKLCEGAI